jgi:hypothetical protein
MPKRRRPGPHKGEDYEVGYGKPPPDGQFRSGQSGNPAGRRKGIRNLKTDVVRTLSAPIKVREGGRTRTRSTQEGALMLLREKALRGDNRALDRLLELAQSYNDDAPEPTSIQPLAPDDQAILAAYVAEATAPSALESHDEAPPPALPKSDPSE